MKRGYMSTEMVAIKAMEKCTAKIDAIYHIIPQRAFVITIIFLFHDNKKG